MEVLAGRRRKRKYWLLPAIVVLVLAALLLPPLLNLGRYQHRIAGSISRSLGRPVEMSSVKLRLLPAPGLDISNFVIDEDPAFGAEPTLRAPSMVAYLRLTSLWRGRLEVSRINLDQPSLNLVRDAQGRWNIGTVLLQAARIPNAPTGQRHAGPAPRFPYIEASDGRINFKKGDEKKPFSLLNADFSMWLASPGEWQLRVDAQPVRTDLDLDLAETGTLRINGSLRRAATVDQMPVNLHADWSNAPLGQISRLLLGQNTGWRGDLRIQADAAGTIDSLHLKTRLRIADMHRQEFAPPEPLNVDATCQANYLRASRSLNNAACVWPVGTGQFLLTGSVADFSHPEPALTLSIDKMPASFALRALRVVRLGAAPSVSASGTVNGHFAFSGAGPLTGQATVQALQLTAPGFAKPVAIPALHFVSAGVAQRPAAHRRRKGRPAPQPAAILLEGFPLTIGPTPLTLGGQFTAAGFALHLGGSSQIKDLLALGHDFGWLQAESAALEPQGTAALDVTIRGPWLPSVAPSSQMEPGTAGVTEGTLSLQNAVYQPAFLAEPVEIASAEASLSPGEAVWNPVAAVYHHIPVQLSVSDPLGCEPPADCAAHFNASVDSLDAAALHSALLGAGEHGELLAQILARFDGHTAHWPALAGTVHANMLTLGRLAVNNATASLAIEGRLLHIVDFTGQALGGTLHAAGSVDATAGAPAYSLNLQLARASTAGLAAIFKEKWGAGTLSASGKLEMSGYSAAQLASSAKGAFHADWIKGALPAAKSSLLAHFDRWSTNGTFSDKVFHVEHSLLVRGAESVPVTGTIGFDRTLDLTLGAQSTITGTLQHPVANMPQK